jgi:hypothetical protein
MDTDTTHSLSMTVSHIMSWGLPQLVIALLVVFAARRYRWIGLRILAAAAILDFLARFTITAFIVFSHPVPYGLASVGSCASTIVFVLAVVGWSMLAFAHTKKVDHDA